MCFITKASEGLCRCSPCYIYYKHYLKNLLSQFDKANIYRNLDTLQICIC